MDYLHPIMQEALKGFSPPAHDVLQITEEEWLAADRWYSHNKAERMAAEQQARAIALEQQYRDAGQI